MGLSSSELEALLAHERWIRALARRLATDPGTADDLVQETWLAALSGRKARPGEPSWLARVLRNAWKDHLRARDRRARRERTVAAPEAPAGADELVAELELRERLTRALRELEEPYRSTLARRFFRDESLGAIARADGVAPSTVHERIARGLERLRARLDAEHGGRRGAWAATMLALGRRGGGGPGPLEVIGMAAGSKAAVAGLVVLAGALGWVWLARERAPEAPVQVSNALTPEPARETAVSVARALAAPSGSAREPIASVRASEGQPMLVEPEAIEGRVVDAAGVPVGSVAVVLSGQTVLQTTTSAPDGRFSFRVDPEDGWRTLRCNDERFVTLVAGAPRGPERLVIVAPACTVAGRVVEPDGRPVAGATLAFRPRPSLFRELGLELAPADQQPGWDARSGLDGTFSLAGVARGEHLGLQARARGFLGHEVDLPASSASELLVVLDQDPHALLLSGRVLGPDGRPYEGARVSAGDEIVHTGPGGHFELAVRSVTGRHLRDERGVWRPEARARARLFAIAAGFAPASADFELAATRHEIVLRLGFAPLSIAGRVIDPQGEPRAGVVLWPRALTVFGQESRALGGGDEIVDQRTVEGELCATGTLGAVTGADGRFELGCLLDQDYDIELFDACTAGRSAVERVPAGRRELEIVLAAEPGTMRVAGRVVSGTGEPVGGVQISPRRAALDGSSVPELAGAEYTRETDAEGRFEFESLATAGTVLDVMSWYRRTFELKSYADLECIEIVLPALCELQVALADPRLADAFGVLDAAGAELEVIEMLQRDGRSLAFSLDERTSLVEGRSSVVRAPETACTLVLFREGVEVLRRPLVLDPQGPTRVEL